MRAGTRLSASKLIAFGGNSPNTTREKVRKITYGLFLHLAGTSPNSSSTKARQVRIPPPQTLTGNTQIPDRTVCWMLDLDRSKTQVFPLMAYPAPPQQASVVSPCS